MLCVVALTSSIYRLAQSDLVYTTDEQRRRLKATLRRLIGQHGVFHVVDCIRAWPGEPAMKLSLIILAESLVQHRGGTM